MNKKAGVSMWEEENPRIRDRIVAFVRGSRYNRKRDRTGPDRQPAEETGGSYDHEKRY